MDRFIFSIQGSAPEPYEIIFQKHEMSIKSSCTCAAGLRAQVCKHVMYVLLGKSDEILCGSEYLPFKAGWLTGSAVENILNEVIRTERELEQAKLALSLAKRNLTKALCG